jgi:hypothetical protein
LYVLLFSILRHDDCWGREGNAAENFAALRHMAHNLARHAPGKMSIRARRKAAAWGDDSLLSLAAA